MKTNHIKKYYYHITDCRKWRKQILLKPKDDSDGRGCDEPVFGRICVCPSVPLCLSAFELLANYMYKVYRTQRPVTAVYPWRLSDKSVTREMWLIEPTKFEFVGKLSKDLIVYLTNNYVKPENVFSFGGAKGNLKLQTKYKNRIFRYFRKHNLNQLP